MRDISTKAEFKDEVSLLMTLTEAIIEQDYFVDFIIKKAINIFYFEII